jgi:DNA-binding GntR family transcriptional regulator
MQTEHGEQDRHGSLKQRVLCILRDEIRTGILGQGVRLVESELTRRLAVSRTPLREALRQLEAEGLVVVEPHRGARVSRKTREDLWEHYRVYAALQGLAAEIAAPKLTAEDLARLEEIQTALEAPGAALQGPAFVALNRDFHAVIERCAECATLSDLIDRQAVVLSRVWPLGVHAPGVLDHSHAHHREILRLARARDATGLRRALEEHFLLTGRLLLEHAASVWAA